MSSFAYYATGTVTVAAGGTAVTGAGTLWSTVIQPGDSFEAGGRAVRVLAVIDDTHLTLAYGWPGTALAASAYLIAYTAPARTTGTYVAERLRELIERQRILDDGVAIYAVQSVGANAPPATPTTGDLHVVGSAATGAWVGYAGHLAVWRGAAWGFTGPEEGMHVYDRAEGRAWAYTALGWSMYAGLASDGIVQKVAALTTTRGGAAWRAEYSVTVTDPAVGSIGADLATFAGWAKGAGDSACTVASGGKFSFAKMTTDTDYTYETGSRSHFMDVEIYTASDFNFPICIKWVGGGSYLTARHIADGTVQVYSYNSSTPTLLFSVSASLGVFTLAASEDDIWTLYRNGEPIASGDVPSHLVAGTKAALRVRNTVAGVLGPIRIGVGSSLPVHGAGVQCWFHEPRAVSAGGKTFVGTNRLSVTNYSGSAAVAQIDETTGASTQVTLWSGSGWQDDHCYPVVLVRPDGRLIAFSSLHLDQTGLRYKVSLAPYDIAGGWSQEYVFAAPAAGGDGVTYPSPAMLSAEGNKIYVFFRNRTSALAYVTSTDLATVAPATVAGGALGATPIWSAETVLIANPGGKGIYSKMWSDGVDRIDFGLTHALAATSGQKIDVRHAYWKGGGLRGSNGAVLGASGVAFSACTPVATSAAPDSLGDTWVWHCCRNRRTGIVQIVFARFLSQSDHRYYYARWDGAAWSKVEIPDTSTNNITYSGSDEKYYSPGVYLDSEHDGVLYASMGPTDAASELYRYVTLDKGQTWYRDKVSPPAIQGARFANENIRPCVPVRRSEQVGVVWFRGGYSHYTAPYAYGTGIMSAPAK